MTRTKNFEVWEIKHLQNQGIELGMLVTLVLRDKQPVLHIHNFEFYTFGSAQKYMEGEIEKRRLDVAAFGPIPEPTFESVCGDCGKIEMTWEEVPHLVCGKCATKDRYQKNYQSRHGIFDSKAA